MSLSSSIGSTLVVGIICQVAAPIIWLDLPKLFRRIKVSNIVDKESITFDDKSYHLSQTVINCRDDSNNRIIISLNKDDKSLLYINDNGHQYGGSGDIGILLFGLPATILFFPIIGLTMIIRFLIEIISGCDWHNLDLFLKIKNQLPTEVAQELFAALKKRDNNV